MNKPEMLNPEENDQVSLLDYLIVMAKYSRLIIFTSAIVMVLTYLILFTIPNKYTAVTRFLPPQQNLTLSAQLLDSLGGGITPGSQKGAGSILPGFAANVLGIRSVGDLYAGMLKSNTISDRLVERFNLQKLYKQTIIEDARAQLRNNTVISIGKDGIITIEVTDTDPKRAAEMANVFLDELDNLLKRMAVHEAQGRLAFLEKERVVTSHNLNKAEESLQKFSERNAVLQIDFQTKGAIQYIGKLRGEIDAKEVQIQVLRQQATPVNFDIVRLETELKGLKGKLHAAESQWENCIGDVCLPTSKTPSLTLEYLRLLREAKFQETLCQLYVRLVEIARLDMARDAPIMQVIDQAAPPRKRSNKRLFPALLAGMLTFVLMIFAAFGYEYWLNIKKREREVQRLGVLGGYLQFWTELPKKIKACSWFKRLPKR